MQSQKLSVVRPPQADPNEDARLEALDQLDILDTPPEEAFDRVTRLIREVLGVRIALVSVIDAHRQWYKSCTGLEATEAARPSTFCTHAIRQSGPLIISDATKDPRFANNPSVTGEPHIRFYAGFPLRTKEGFTVGTVCAIDTEPRDLTVSEAAILADLAQMAMDLMQLRQLATVDGLTGALSRKAFRDEGLRSISLAQRHKHHLSCVSFDLDHFKAINDNHGHAAGDAVLSEIVAACRGELRGADPVGRLGGEEFAVLLPHTDRAGALDVAEKLRSAVKRQRFEFDSKPLRVTASFGVATLDLATKDIDTLLAHADSALYEAKAAGRDRCVGWRRPEPAVERNPRRRVLKSGQIHFNNRMSTIDCTVRSLGPDGAGIDVTSSIGVPERFNLSVPSDALDPRCRVVSRSERHLEVEFC